MEKEKEIITIKHRESLSFAEARKIVDARHALGASYSSFAKSSSAKTVNMKDAQTQTNDASVQTETPEKQISPPAKTSKKPTVNRKSEKPIVKSPKKTQNKVLSDRLPKGSDDQIQQHNRFECLDEDMEAEDTNTESIPNKQGHIIKLK